MKFMLISLDDEQYWEDVGPAVHQEAHGEAIELTHDLDRQGQYLFCSPLQRSNTATLVRVRDGKTSVTAGPYAETREAIGGLLPDRSGQRRGSRRHRRPPSGGSAWHGRDSADHRR